MALLWLLGTGLVLSAGEAERLRRHVVQPALCLGSAVLLRGDGCQALRQAAVNPL